MYCPKCGKENPDDARSCSSCGFDLVRIRDAAEGVKVKTSTLAVVSLLFAILYFLTLLVLLLARTTQPRMMRFLRPEVLLVLYIITPVAAVVLGIISLIRIELSGGKLTGILFAGLGIAIPIIVFFFMFANAALNPPRSVAFRMTCGTNLSGIGKAMLIYANDYEDEFPRAGGPDSRWTGRIPNWLADSRFRAYGLAGDRSGGSASISSSFYLLVKYAELSPQKCVCTHDSGTKVFELDNYRVGHRDLIDLWDFGPEPWKHCSYTYHMPCGLYALTTSFEPGLAVAADRNPWIDSPAGKARDFSRFKPEIDPWNGTVRQGKYGNAITHQGEGQNVLFIDSHVNFEKRAFCGVQDDNIYTFWDGQDRVRGVPPVLGSQPQGRLDSLLVHDPPILAKKR